LYVRTLFYWVCVLSLYSFFFNGSGDHRALHSFPTRRSSDLSRSAGCFARFSAARTAATFDVTPVEVSLWTRSTARSWWAESISSDRKSTRLNSSHVAISYAVFCLKKKKKDRQREYERHRSRA